MLKRHIDLQAEFTPTLLLPFLPFLILGIAPGYYILCGYVNETHVRVDDQTITVNHHPLPWFGNKRIYSGNVKELYITHNRLAGRNSWGPIYGVVNTRFGLPW